MDRSESQPEPERLENHVHAMNSVQILKDFDIPKVLPESDTGKLGLPQLELCTSGSLASGKDIIVNGNNNTQNGNDNSVTINVDSSTHNGGNTSNHHIF
jgi:hypothetical protein